MESVDVVVAGAGLAGLVAARRLTQAGLHVALVEASDRPGGRLATDEVDGLLLDRGFQLLNPAYPELTRFLDLEALRLQPFDRGVAVRLPDTLSVLADPLQLPTTALGSLRSPAGSLAQKLRLAAWWARVGFGPAGRIKRDPDEPFSATLRRHGLADGLGETVLQPFLSGVLAEAELDTSRRVVELFLRSFIRGTPALPADGIRAVPAQLAATLPAGTLRLGTAVTAIDGTSVTTDAGTLIGRAVIVACDPVTACRLTGLPAPAMRALTTYYHLADTPPTGPTTAKLLHVDGTHSGPVVNTAVVSNVAPTYSARGALVASTVLGTPASTGVDEAAVRAHAGRIYGADARGWTHVRTDEIPHALPAMPAGTPLRNRTDLGGGLFVAGDHRDTPSIQGAMVSGRRVADEVLAAIGAGVRS